MNVLVIQFVFDVKIINADFAYCCKIISSVGIHMDERTDPTPLVAL